MPLLGCGQVRDGSKYGSLLLLKTIYDYAK